MIGTFSNGQVVALAQVSVARFNADNSLKRLDGGAFEETIESGPPIIGLGTSQMVGGSVEQSNTDIADEFSKMIVTQPVSYTHLDVYKRQRLDRALEFLIGDKLA